MPAAHTGIYIQPIIFYLKTLCRKKSWYLHSVAAKGKLQLINNNIPQDKSSGNCSDLEMTPSKGQPNKGKLRVINQTGTITNSTPNIQSNQTPSSNTPLFNDAEPSSGPSQHHFVRWEEEPLDQGFFSLRLKNSRAKKLKLKNFFAKTQAFFFSKKLKKPENFESSFAFYHKSM